MDPRSNKLIISNNIDQLPELAKHIEQLCDKWNLKPALGMSLNLVIEEAVSNIIFYAYTDKERHDIEIDFTLHSSQISITITDDGKPFDPTQKKDPDTTLTVEKRQIGGLGIYLMNKIMDEVKYKRVNNNNKLTLIKKI